MSKNLLGLSILLAKTLPLPISTIIGTGIAAYAYNNAQKANEENKESSDKSLKTDVDSVSNAESVDDLREKAKRLQDNLPKIRSLLNWTASDLGQQIDMSKQAISNLENKKTVLSGAQYLAIKSKIIESLIKSNDIKLSLFIANIFTFLVDSPESFPSAKKAEINQKIDMLIDIKKVKGQKNFVEYLTNQLSMDMVNETIETYVTKLRNELNELMQTSRK